MRRVVVTGLGMVTPLGCGVEATWKRLIEGESGARKIELSKCRILPARSPASSRAATAPTAPSIPTSGWSRRSSARSIDFIIYAMARRAQALDDAGWNAVNAETSNAPPACMIGSGIGGVGGIAEGAILVKERGPAQLSPFFIPGRIINLASGYVSIEFGLKGPNPPVVTACSTGAHAIGDAGRMIALGDADVMVAGGAESPVDRLSLAGFAACRALSTGFNDTPHTASRPYDKDRDGFVMGEGAGCGRARGIRARRSARRQNLCRTDRLRPVGRRLSHHRAGRRTATARSAA